MDLVISQQYGIPIYEQIMTQVTSQIITGHLASGDKLPSVRALARMLGVSVITIRRAYDGLEREGYLVTMHGKGTYVSERDLIDLKDTAILLVEEKLSEVVSLARSLEISNDSIIKILTLLLKEE